MAVDIAPELLLKIQTDFQKSIEQSVRIKELYSLLKAGKATYKEASEYAELIGDFLAAAFKRHISSEALPDGRLYFNIADRLIRSMLESDYKLVTDFAAEVQAALNKQAGISIKPVVPKINEDYMKAIIDRVAIEPRFDDVMWVLQEPITNFSMATVDDAVRENAGLHYKAGLSPKIIRTTTGTPCKWCASLAGTYDYAKAPKIVFKRHKYCKCLIEYNPQDGAKRIDVHTKRGVGTDEEKEARIQMYENDKKELAKDAEKRRLARIELAKTKKGA
jgi:hypothetical protein